MSNPLLTQFAIKVLFEELYVPVVYRVLTNSLPMYASSAVTGLVVDVGFASTQILPIYEGYPIIKAFQSTPAAAALLHKRMSSVVQAQGLTATFEVLEDIVVTLRQTRTMFLPYGELARTLQTTEQERTYSIKPETCPRHLTITFSDRISPAQELFGSLESDEPNIAQSLLRALQKVPSR